MQSESGAGVRLTLMLQHFEARYHWLHQRRDGYVNASPAMQWQLLSTFLGYRFWLSHCRHAALELSTLLPRMVDSDYSADPWLRLNLQSLTSSARLALAVPMSVEINASQARDYVFIAGLEGTGHHVWSNMLQTCQASVCTRTTDLSLAVGEQQTASALVIKALDLSRTGAGRWLGTRACWEIAAFQSSEQRSHFAASLAARIEQTDQSTEWSAEIEQLYQVRVRASVL